MLEKAREKPNYMRCKGGRRQRSAHSTHDPRVCKGSGRMWWAGKVS